MPYHSNNKFIIGKNVQFRRIRPILRRVSGRLLPICQICTATQTRFFPTAPPLPSPLPSFILSPCLCPNEYPLMACPPSPPPHQLHLSMMRNPACPGFNDIGGKEDDGSNKRYRFDITERILFLHVFQKLKENIVRQTEWVRIWTPLSSISTLSSLASQSPTFTDI